MTETDEDGERTGEGDAGPGGTPDYGTSGQEGRGAPGTPDDEPAENP